MPKKYLTHTLLFLFVLILQSCSTKFLYTQLDWVVTANIERYVALDEDQSDLLLKQLEKYFKWHRRTQIPLYSTWIQTFRNDIESGLNRTNMNAHLTTINIYYKVFFAKFVDNTAILFPNLTDDQIDELMVYFADKNEDYQEKYLNKNKEELKQHKLNDLTEKLEKWLDDITDEQKAMLIDFLQDYDWHYEERYQLSLEWQRQLSVFLHQANKGENVIEQIKKLNYDDFRDQQSKNKTEERTQAFLNLVIAISKTITKEQKEYLLEKIDDYNTLFQELS